MYGNKIPINRYTRTAQFLKNHVPQTCSILDLGIPNPMSDLMDEMGYKVINTQGEDLDLEPLKIKEYSAEVTTAFEILEHLVSPFPLLQYLPTSRLVATVPLRLWFAKAYRSNSDERDQHYHEFEAWQFDWLLQKAGWNVIHRERWISPTGKIGLRPLLRNFTPRYYAVYAERR